MEAKNKQESLFDFPKMEINNPIRLIELFGGIGSQAMALRDIGANFETYKLVEFDKYAVQSYNAIHGTHFETTDIRNVHGADLEIKDRDKYTYLMTYSFPCTDLSVAGKMQGMSKEAWKNGEATRSGLLWEVERILKELPDDQLPQVLLMENVPQVHAEKNEADFNSWLDFLTSKGYINFYDDLNAKDYGIPQNRDRCFCVSFLADEFTEYDFPEKVKLEKVMSDYLEDEVDEKYYINTQKAKELIEKLVDDGVLGGLQEHQTQRNDGVCPSLTAAMGMGGGQIPVIKEKDNRTEQNRTAYQSPDNVSSNRHGQRQSELRTGLQNRGCSSNADGEGLQRTGQLCQDERCNRETVYMNYKRIDRRNTDVAKTLCARDYKGFANYELKNGVIEWSKQK